MLQFVDIDELNAFVSALSPANKWQSLTSEQQNVIIARAIHDIAAYAHSVNVPLDLENEDSRQAVIEQTLHISEQLGHQENGRIILEENISGFGSRKYKDPTANWLSPRACAYIDKQIIPKTEDTENPENQGGSGNSGNSGGNTNTPSGGTNAPGTDNNGNSQENPQELPIGPIRILR